MHSTGFSDGGLRLQSLGRSGDPSRSYALLNGLVKVECDAARNSASIAVKIIQDLRLFYMLETNGLRL